MMKMTRIVCDMCVIERSDVWKVRKCECVHVCKCECDVWKCVHVCKHECDVWKCECTCVENVW